MFRILRLLPVRSDFVVGRKARQRGFAYDRDMLTGHIGRSPRQPAVLSFTRADRARFASLQNAARWKAFHESRNRNPVIDKDYLELLPSDGVRKPRSQ
jgi:hypothetical protein